MIAGNVRVRPRGWVAGNSVAMSPFGSLHVPVPGTDFYKWADGLNSYLKLGSWQDAADIVDKVQESYPSASAAQGAPYVANSTQGEAIAQAVSDATGVSFGRTKAALNVLQSLAASGQVGNDTYNPGQYSTAAKVASAVSSAVAGAKKIAKEVTPQAVQDIVSGAGDAASGVGTLLKWAPWLAVAGVGAWVLVSVKNGRNPLDGLR